MTNSEKIKKVFREMMRKAQNDKVVKSIIKGTKRKRVSSIPKKNKK